MSSVADALLEAHVQHVLAQWRNGAAARSIEERVVAVLRWLGDVKVDQVATRAQVIGLIQRHVIERRIGAGVSELAGELSQLVFSSQSSATTRLDQVLADSEYEEFAQKVVALEGVRRGLLAMIAQSEAFGALRTRIIARTLSALAFRRGRLRNVTGNLLPALEERASRVLARYFERRQAAPRDAERELLELVEPEWLRSLIDEIWAAVARRPLAEAFAFIGEQDLEDFVVLGFEFWLRYRKSDYFRRIMEEVVDHFFHKYGGLSLLELLEDMGVNEATITQELRTFLVPLVERAAQTGFFEQQIRASLAPFYASPATAEILRSKP